MKIGIIARCDTTGLGIQAKEFYDHIPCKALVVDVSKVNQGMKQNHDWYPGAQIWYYTKAGRIPVQMIKDFLDGLDVMVTFETPYDYSIFSLARLMKVKTVLQLNYEFLEYPSKFSPPDLFAAPSLWHYPEIPDPKVYLPVPVAAEKFTPRWREKTFVHVAGKPAVHDRNGTQVFLNCLKYVKSEINVHLYCQTAVSVPDVPANINLETHFGNKENYAENYQGGVMVLPRKYGGLSLVVNESLAAGMPVIMPDISPNNEWLPKEWLVPAIRTGSFMCRKPIDIFEAESYALAAKIDELAENEVSFLNSLKAARMGLESSWEAMKPRYLEVFRGLVG